MMSALEPIAEVGYSTLTSIEIKHNLHRIALATIDSKGGEKEPTANQDDFEIIALVLIRIMIWINNNLYFNLDCRERL